jgi:tRNA pseudouridine55 synthase
MDGLLVIDKPAGPTSHDVVARLRRVLGETRIGHTGTLDPAASGVLPLVLGRATRLARFMSSASKRYQAVVRFGQATDTHDAQGIPIGERSFAALPPRDAIDAALDAFRGTFAQQPPAFSAKKIAGRRSYETARAGRNPSALSAAPALPAAVTVTVHELLITDVGEDCVGLRVHCSSGFYVRALAHDLGARLGIGAHLASLRRTESAGLTLAQAVPLAAAERSRDDALAAILPLERMLEELPSLELTDQGVERATHGQDVKAAEVARGTWSSAGNVRLFSPRGELVGIAERAASGALHPCVVLR